ncbi:MAG: sigma-70 family RNA polymerase sigma factor [Polyangiaceae bacterium]
MTVEPNSDATALVRAATAGDAVAFGRLFERFAPMVHGVLLSRVPSADADDLTQEVFMVAQGRLTELHRPEAFGAWLGAIARNRATDFLRRRKPHAELSFEVPSQDPERSAAEQALHAIRSLPEAYVEPLILRLVEGMTGPEIAERTGLTPESVRVNLHRGMRLLRERMRSDDE